MAWLVVTSLAGQQLAAVDRLGAQGFIAYRPLYREKRYVRGRKTFRDCSLFGRYFFVHEHFGWRAILHTRGIDELLMVDEHPLGVANDEIDQIRAREDARGIIHLNKGFQPGQKVRVKRGHLTGLVGTFVTLGSRDREIALFELLGQMTKVELAAGSLAAVA